MNINNLIFDNACVTFDFRNDMKREEIIKEFKDYGINCDLTKNNGRKVDYIDDSFETVLDLVESLVSKNESLHDVVCSFNCLEQNIKGDKFKCKEHCGKCVK